MRPFSVKSEIIVRFLNSFNSPHLIFEIKSNIKETICGGGAYFFNNTQCFGYAFGLDRLAILTKENFSLNKKLVLSINEDKEAIGVAEKLRENGDNVYLWTGKIGKGMDYANSKKVTEVIFVGADEIKTGKFKVRNMESGKETFLKMEKLK